jgi:hypothetical protein
VPGVVLIGNSDRQWTLDVRGPLGPVLEALADLPVHDIQIEPFRLEDYVARFYRDPVTQGSRSSPS